MKTTIDINPDAKIKAGKVTKDRRIYLPSEFQPGEQYILAVWKVEKSIEKNIMTQEVEA